MFAVLWPGFFCLVCRLLDHLNKKNYGWTYNYPQTPLEGCGLCPLHRFILLTTQICVAPALAHRVWFYDHGSRFWLPWSFDCWRPQDRVWDSRITFCHRIIVINRTWSCNGKWYHVYIVTISLSCSMSSYMGCCLHYIHTKSVITVMISVRTIKELTFSAQLNTN